EAPEVEVETGGNDFPIRKVKPGGWSQRRYQERAENTWEQNADDAAKQLTTLVDHYDPRLIVATGDVRALQLLREALPDEVLQLVTEVEGDPAELADAAVKSVATAVATDTVALIEKFKEERGQHDRAAAGAGATL